MKVVVTAQGNTLQSPVDPRFGRARYFLLVDTDTGQFTVHDNTQNLNVPQGAGIQSAQTVSRLGAEAVAIEQLKAGRLSGASKPDVQGHWA